MRREGELSRERARERSLGVEAVRAPFFFFLYREKESVFLLFLFKILLNATQRRRGAYMNL